MQKKTQCTVCGVSPTVRSHLFPRALSNMLKERFDGSMSSDYPIIEIEKDNSFFPVKSGEFSNDILCSEHENYLNTKCDRYSIDFLRKTKSYIYQNKTNFNEMINFSRRNLRCIFPDEFNNMSAQNFFTREVNGDILFDFVISTIWRFSISKNHIGKLTLDPHAKNVVGHLFENIRMNESVDCFFSAVYYDINGVENHSITPVNFEIGRRKSKCIAFYICGFRFFLVLEKYKIDEVPEDFWVRGKSKLKIFLEPWMNSPEQNIVREYYAKQHSAIKFLTKKTR